jgi:hypothetical protein
MVESREERMRALETETPITIRSIVFRLEIFDQGLKHETGEDSHADDFFRESATICCSCFDTTTTEKLA